MSRERDFVWLTLGAIGDVLMVVSAADAVTRVSLSEAIVATTKNQQAIQELASANPRISVVNIRSLSFLLGRKKVLLMPSTFGTLPLALKCLAFGAKLFGHTIVGFRDKGWFQPYTHTLQFDSEIPFIKNLERQLHTVSETNKIALAPLAVFAPRAQKKYPKNSYILVHPMPANRKRTLPGRRWSRLLAALQQQHPELKVVVHAAPGERVILQEWLEELSYIDILESESLLRLAGYLADARLYLGVDTGVTHLAGVMGVSSVILGNNSNPTWLPVYNLNARILTDDTRCTCSGDKGGDCSVLENGQEYYRCLYDLSDEVILEAVNLSLK